MLVPMLTSFRQTALHASHDAQVVRPGTIGMSDLFVATREKLEGNQ